MIPLVELSSYKGTFDRMMLISIISDWREKTEVWYGSLRCEVEFLEKCPDFDVIKILQDKLPRYLWTSI
jgi:hypothetical protein